MNSLVDFLKELVSIKTELRIEDGKVIRENYEKAAEFIASSAEDLGLKIDTVVFEDRFGKVPVVMIEPEGVDREESIALVSHYDVVPAKGPWLIKGHEMDPYEPLLIDGKLYGRGAADDKSAIAASIYALKEALEEGRRFKFKPVLVIAGDEEGGPLGIKTLLDEGFKWDKAVILDASADYLSIGASGVIHGWVRVFGKNGHAGYPHIAENAVSKLVNVISFIQEEYGSVRYGKISRYPSPPGSPFPNLWGRFNFTILKLGEGEVEKHNVIPGEAVAGFDARLLPEEDDEEAVRELVSFFSKAFSKYGVKGCVEIIAKLRGWYTTDEKLKEDAVKSVKKAIKTVGLNQEVRIAAELGGNDGTFFFLKGIPVVAIGAIRSENNIHSDNEFVYIRDVEFLKEFVKALVTEG
ncbi:MAG: hypothetical protein DRJ38_09775 [Thermoprotei archaeon]|nr:MAG: hypothetical protein DRJ38_09775 [Thermoprotei archaeon]